MSDLLHCSHKAALDVSYSGGRKVPKAVIENVLPAPYPLIKAPKLTENLYQSALGDLLF
jgi:hypothetical protein